jgi:hypothetical protein
VVPFRKEQGNEASAIIGAVIYDYTQPFQETLDGTLPWVYLMAALGLVFVIATGGLASRQPQKVPP